jgi:hypothetical protein
MNMQSQKQKSLGEVLAGLSKTRGGIVGLIRSEPTNRVGTTRLTTDTGETIEFESTAIAAKLSLTADEILATDISALVAALDGQRLSTGAVVQPTARSVRLRRRSAEQQTA